MCREMSFITFYTAPAIIQYSSDYSLIGLYSLTIFTVNRLIRTWRFRMSFRIMFDDMPSVDWILQLCINIYLARESKEYSLEEDLYAKLVFLYRSPQTLIEVTRHSANEIKDK